MQDVASRLIAIPISHYCERARWALDICGVPYREEHHLQMFHRLPVMRAGGGKTTPVLVTPDRGTLADSADIVAYADERARAGAHLYPRDPEARAEVEAWERELEGRFGVETRRIAYQGALGMGRRLLPYNAGAAPAWERAMLSALYPGAARLLSKYLGVTEAKIRRARAWIEEPLDRVAEAIGSSRYLSGDAFTAADLTFAALVAPLVLPPEYGGPLPGALDIGEDYRARVQYYRAHPAGAFALRLYREHRRPGAAGGGRVA